MAPQPEAQVLSGGHVINISWEEPYSHDTFPILFYNLTIQNQTENSSFSEMLPDTVLSYNIVKNSVSTTCHTLTFVLTACNSIGVSDEGNDTGGFPVGKTYSSFVAIAFNNQSVPEVQELMMQYNVTFIEDVTLLYIYFQVNSVYII